MMLLNNQQQIPNYAERKNSCQYLMPGIPSQHSHTQVTSPPSTSIWTPQCWDNTLILKKLNFRWHQSRKLLSDRFNNAVHLAHTPIIAEQNDLERVLYPLSVLAAPSTDRQTFIIQKWILKPRKKLSPKSVLPQARLLSKQLETV